MLDIICGVLILLSVFLSGLFLGFLLWYKQRADLVSMDTVRKVHEDFLDAQEKVITEVISEEKNEVAREIFWEIDKLLTRIITDDEDGTQFIGIDMQKYYLLKKKYGVGGQSGTPVPPGEDGRPMVAPTDDKMGGGSDGS